MRFQRFFGLDGDLDEDVGDQRFLDMGFEVVSCSWLMLTVDARSTQSTDIQRFTVTVPSPSEQKRVP